MNTLDMRLVLLLLGAPALPPLIVGRPLRLSAFFPAALVTLPAAAAALCLGRLLACAYVPAPMLSVSRAACRVGGVAYGHVLGAVRAVPTFLRLHV